MGEAGTEKKKKICLEKTVMQKGKEELKNGWKQVIEVLAYQTEEFWFVES